MGSQVVFWYFTRHRCWITRGQKIKQRCTLFINYFFFIIIKIVYTCYIVNSIVFHITAYDFRYSLGIQYILYSLNLYSMNTYLLNLFFTFILRSKITHLKTPASINVLISKFLLSLSIKNIIKLRTTQLYQI